MNTQPKASWTWGLVGPGRFARSFTGELRTTPRAQLGAVASRDLERSSSFAEEFGFQRAYGSYDELWQDDEIDVVSITVPHVFHRQVAEAAIEAGKAVVCEKPLTPNAAETRALTSLAAERGVFLMEAMKTGFLPAILTARRWLEEGKIGEPQILKADFCFQGPSDPKDRLMNPALAGGAVLDVGIYPLYLAWRLLGEVEQVKACGQLAPTGVDQSAAITLRHHCGAASALTCSFQSEKAMDACILGTRGEIRLPVFHAGKQAELWVDGVCQEQFTDDSEGMLHWEIDAVHSALDTDILESPGHTHADSIRLAELMDAVLEQLGVNAVG